MEHIKAFRKVAEFSKAINQGTPFPKDYIQQGDVEFLIGQVVSEAIELADSKSIQLLPNEGVLYAFDLLKHIDAGIDMMYYIADTAARNGLGLEGYELRPGIRNFHPECSPTINCLGRPDMKHISKRVVSEIVACIGKDADMQEHHLYTAFTFIYEQFALKTGINLLDFFDVVHAANMRKVVDGVCVLRGDGKIMKPEGWVGPDEDMKKLLDGTLRQKRTV